ncbi:2-dehydro-3-deoxy-6-phosphogalactonate aldolase [Neoroseomonas oryzicola]|uniref:2-dehydro-3-deoxy-6-phosphogalactonate aldolase n=1 Tax=Neoroseomonas oryzicola TaxID=535904 RepID=A0A9X9WHA6_9PROT|nr:2-dehydro-3-deoxy-6-phosphogalactonate aldolase [Neoroseomonas oryzicola]MBR0659716.1 2-dehydro-3-deoxy-6-phosphogalactonate aldolase [Neoroseomonas oryzicola]NKE17146.1 2-dehydro-3-deoxy-6-phosphogalactonate aldolase [Neoroseomonas oryzicola]
MSLAPWLDACPIVAILRGVQPEEVEAIASALIHEGLNIIEVPLNSPRPLESIRRLHSAFAERALVGAGTVTTEDEVAAIVRAGAKLMVTPHCDPDLVRAARARGLIACPGFMTPAEAFALLAAGADALKLFPAEAVSPAVVKALLAVLPKGTAILPVGGMSAETIPAWKAAGAAGFGVGSSLYAPGDSPATVAAKARALRSALGLG